MKTAEMSNIFQVKFYIAEEYQFIKTKPKVQLTSLYLWHLENVIRKNIVRSFELFNTVFSMCPPPSKTFISLSNNGMDIFIQ